MNHLWKALYPSLRAPERKKKSPLDADVNVLMPMRSAEPLGVHWVLGIVNFRRKFVAVYDGLLRAAADEVCDRNKPDVTALGGGYLEAGVIDVFLDALVAYHNATRSPGDPQFAFAPTSTFQDDARKRFIHGTNRQRVTIIIL